MPIFRKAAPVKSYWWNARPNFGDALAPLLLERFADIPKVEWGTPCQASVITVGSILEQVPLMFDGYVLGTGKLYEDSRVYLYAHQTKVLALRGPLSARFYGSETAIGDPGLLADELLNNGVLGYPERTYDLGILPHWRDSKLKLDKRFQGKWSVLTIDPSSPPLEVVRAIGQCKKIVTSSLHGLIVADAFGIPRRFEYTPALDREGGRFKFRDYHQSIGMNLTTGVTQVANFRHVEDRKSELWDAYRELGTVLRVTR